MPRVAAWPPPPRQLASKAKPKNLKPAAALGLCPVCGHSGRSAVIKPPASGGAVGGGEGGGREGRRARRSFRVRGPLGYPYTPAPCAPLLLPPSLARIGDASARQSSPGGRGGAEGVRRVHMLIRPQAAGLRSCCCCCSMLCHQAAVTAPRGLAFPWMVYQCHHTPPYLLCLCRASSRLGLPRTATLRHSTPCHATLHHFAPRHALPGAGPPWWLAGPSGSTPRPSA